MKELQNPVSLGKGRVCGMTVWEDDDIAQDFVSGWLYHSSCSLMIPESTKRSEPDAADDCV